MSLQSHGYLDHLALQTKVEGIRGRGRNRYSGSITLILHRAVYYMGVLNWIERLLADWIFGKIGENIWQTPIAHKLRLKLLWKRCQKYVDAKYTY